MKPSIIAKGLGPWPALFNNVTLWLGISCITAIEIHAINQGMNGILLTTIVAVIAACIGVTIPQPKFLSSKV